MPSATHIKVNLSTNVNKFRIILLSLLTFVKRFASICFCQKYSGGGWWPCMAPIPELKSYIIDQVGDLQNLGGAPIEMGPHDHERKS